MDKARKRELVKAWTKEQRSIARARLPLTNPEFGNLFEMLDQKISQLGCDHSLKMTRAWLKSRQRNLDVVFEWFDDNGGCCDCEVLFNCEDKRRWAIA